jgi:hypothetical protein
LSLPGDFTLSEAKIVDRKPQSSNIVDDSIPFDLDRFAGFARPLWPWRMLAGDCQDQAFFEDQAFFVCCGPIVPFLVPPPPPPFFFFFFFFFFFYFYFYSSSFSCSR